MSVRRSAPWTTQPQFAAPVASADEAVTWLPSTGVVTGGALTGATQGVIGNGVNEYGRAYTPPGFTTALGTIAAPTNGVTFVVVAKRTGALVPSGLGFSDSTNRINVHLPYSDGTVYWDYGGVSGANRLSHPTYADGVWVFTGGPSGSRIFLNGVLLQSSNTAINCAAATGTFGMGVMPSVSADTNAAYSLIHLRGRQVSDDEARSLSVNPWQIFTPTNRWTPLAAFVPFTGHPGTTIGVISFPWHQSTGPARTGEQSILSPAAAHPITPYLGTVTGANTVAVDTPSQAGMDKILSMLVACGVDYIAFDYYANAKNYLTVGGIPVWEGIQNALTLYLSSPLRKQIKFSLVLVADHLGTSNPPVAADWAAVEADIVSYLVRPEFVKGSDGRPLVFMFAVNTWNSLMGGTALAKLVSLRAAAVAAGLTGGICIVNTETGANVGNTQFGGDCVTAYNYVLSGAGAAVPYATYSSNLKAQWASWKTTGTYVVPCASLGWDYRSRCATQFWDTYYGTGVGNPGFETVTGDYVDGQVTTSDQVASHIKDALDFVAANPTNCAAMSTVLVNSLDENSESGNSLLPCPMHTGDPYLQVLARTLGRQADNPMALRARGITLVNRPDRARSVY